MGKQQRHVLSVEGSIMSSVNMKKYDELLNSLRKVTRAIDLYSKKLSKETGLTSPQLILLQQVAANDGVMVKQIASNINLSSATVTSILDRLEARNYVIRERSTTDKRKVGLHITNQGLMAIELSPLPMQDNFIQQFESLAQWEQTQMIANLQRLASMMEPVLEQTKNE